LGLSRYPSPQTRGLKTPLTLQRAKGAFIGMIWSMGATGDDLKIAAAD
jgi:hypothetical protein